MRIIRSQRSHSEAQASMETPQIPAHTAHSCYASQLEIFLIVSSMQLPFRNAKFDITVDEPGLGKISGCRITIKTQVGLCHLSLSLSLFLSLMHACALQRSAPAAARLALSPDDLLTS